MMTVEDTYPKMPSWPRTKVGSHPTLRSGGDCGGGMV